jgi:hypothetical protein
MRSPEDFSDDIIETAYHLTESAWLMKHPELAMKVAAALMERDRAATERAAKIADTIEQPGIPGTSEWLALGQFAAQIRDAILSQSEQHYAEQD